MIRKAIAITMLLLFGLFQPAGAMARCVCFKQIIQLTADSCCEAEVDTCCEASDDATSEEEEGCCGDPQCCLHFKELPDGQEPTATQVPVPLTSPLLATETVLSGTSAAPSVLALSRALRAPPRSAQAVSRLSYGVWRL